MRQHKIKFGFVSLICTILHHDEKTNVNDRSIQNAKKAALVTTSKEALTNSGLPEKNVPHVTNNPASNGISITSRYMHRIVASPRIYYDIDRPSCLLKVSFPAAISNNYICIGFGAIARRFNRALRSEILTRWLTERLNRHTSPSLTFKKIRNKLIFVTSFL